MDSWNNRFKRVSIFIYFELMINSPSWIYTLRNPLNGECHESFCFRFSFITYLPRVSDYPFSGMHVEIPLIRMFGHSL
jgi:hypothetical protein